MVIKEKLIRGLLLLKRIYIEFFFSSYYRVGVFKNVSLFCF